MRLFPSLAYVIEQGTGKRQLGYLFINTAQSTLSRIDPVCL
jgi:hypothetical protein